MTDPLRALGYQRVSTGRQAESGISLEDQAARIEADVKRRGWMIVDTLVDEGRSGRNLRNRPALMAALDALAAGEADALVVAKLDRLARSTIDLASIMRRAEREGWALVVLDPDLDMTSPAGRLTATVLGAVAEYESELIGERARMTHRHRRASGLRAGQAPILHQAVRSEISERREAGETLASIANDLNDREVPTARGGLWHPATVAHVVRSVALDRKLAST